MDQLKEFFGLFKRQHFWFILPVLLILSVAGWWMASGTIGEAVESNRRSIDSQLGKAKGVYQVADHPNTAVHSGQEQLNKNRLENVKNAWEKKWQRQANILVWPEGNWSFRNKVEGKRHIESLDVKAVGLNSFDLAQFKDYVKQQLPKLAARIDANWDPTGRSNNRTEEGEEVDSEERPAESYLVEWEKESQQDIALIFDWGTGFPSTLEMFYAQEDLWVLSAMMDIIAKTNEGARSRATAAVKKIEMLDFGQNAVMSKFKIQTPTPPAGSGDEDDPMAADSFDAAPEEEDSSEEDDEDGPKKLPHPALNRYVDASFQPIEQVSPEVLGVAKRIPVRIRLVMDQRKINDFLAVSANSPLTFEVRQLRYNPKTRSTSGRRRRERTYDDDGGLNVNRPNKVKQLGDVSTFDRVVEFYGFIYIFNPVNESLLGVDVEA